MLEFLNSLANKGIKLSVQGDDLSCYAQTGALTTEIQAGLVKHKPEILVMLRGNGMTHPDATPIAFKPGAAERSEFPLSTGQRTHYLLQTLNPHRSYAVPICLRITRPLDAQRLQRAWEYVLAQYPILTARILEKNGTLYQSLDPQRRSTVHSEDVSEGEDRLLEFLQQKVVQPFDLQQGPLARIELFNRPGRDKILLIVVHHIIFDGFSAGILLKSLFAFYRDLSLGRQPHLAKALPGYRAFVSWERSC